MRTEEMPLHSQSHLLLVDANVELLRQAIVLLRRLSDKAYAEAAPGPLRQRAGAQMRHVIEFYESFLDGTVFQHIDYDRRKRDELVETNRAVAIEKITNLIFRLQNTPELLRDSVLRVVIEDAPAAQRDHFLKSSIGRELQALRSHTIHHYALIAFILSAHSVEVDPTFGVAPSTLRHRERVSEAGLTEAA